VAARTVRRAHRAYRVPIRATGLDARDGFDETTLGYTPEEARAEAARCLDCDTLCSLCVGVCPNMALLTYETAPVRANVPTVAVAGETVAVTGTTPFAVDQAFQVAVLADMCNECGACVTACPTSGRPYRDKPRLYVDAADFAAEADNAYRLLGEGVIEGRFAGATHRLTATEGVIAYEAPGLRATLDRATFAVLEAAPTADGDDGADDDAISLRPAAVLATLLGGIVGSAAHLPTGVLGGAATRVEPPILD
jgi:putative selenate reductase